jgi:hypothetical protein
MLSSSPLAYNKSAQQAQNEQMLLNLVRTRYLDPPFFLQIGSISTSYSYGGSVGGGISIPKEELPDLGIVPTATGTLQGTYQELPTFTFSPLQGNQYFKYLLENVELTQLALLENWPFDFIMNTLVERFGSTYNVPSASNNTYKDFLALGEALARLEQRRQMHFLYQPPLSEKSQGRHILRLTYQDRQEAQTIEKLLGITKRIKPQPSEPLIGLYRLVPANVFVATTEDEAGMPIVTIKLRSFLEVLSLFGQGVDVPPEHFKKGLVMGTKAFANHLSHMPIIRVRQHDRKHSDTFMEVAYRGRWFYIEDTDVESKRIFAFLNLLFSMQTQSIMGQQPSLTIPVR